MMVYLWVSHLRGGVTLGAFVLPHVPWMPWKARWSGGRPSVALVKGSMQIIRTLWLWGTLPAGQGVRGHCREGGDTAGVGDTDGRSLR